MKIAELGERALIKQISALLGSNAVPGQVGIGDDAALTQPQDGLWLVTTKDMLMEGIHFLLPAISAVDLGYKALAVNASDIAAMGGVPRHAYVGLALPKETEVDFILDFYRGVKQMADSLGMSVSGGDTVGSPGPLVISVTVQGEVDRAQALLRSGAKPGDILCATGPLGASAAGLALLLENRDCPEHVRKAALTAHLRPTPRVPEGIWLSQSGAVSAAMDLSDGLLKDLQEICEASGCGAELFQEQIPVHDAAAVVAGLLERPPLGMALNGGEDYELLLAVRPDRYEALAGAYRSRFSVGLFRFGRITAGTGLFMITNEGKREKLHFTGFSHF